MGSKLSVLIDEIIEKLKIDKDKVGQIETFLDGIKSLIPFKEICILSINEDTNSAVDIRLNNKSLSNFSLDKKGILPQCYHSQQSLYVNDISRSLLFNNQIDLIGKKDIVKVLVSPIISSGDNKKVLGIVWIGLEKGFQQFIYEDVEILERFIHSTGKYILNNGLLYSDDSQESIAECKGMKKTLLAKMKRVENYYASTIHDIRTPMSAIMGFMELMLLDEENEEKRGYIDSSLRSAEHIIALINDALDMSKVSSGKMRLDKTNFSPIIGLGDIAKLFSNSMKKNSIKFNVYIDPLMPSTINSDLYRIKQIINNLLSNAMKFTPLNGVVSLEAYYDKNSSTLEISVSDTGIGIAKDRQKSIFSPYVQESDTTSSQYGGTGLGLAISQQLSILLGGTISIESEQGHGSIFRVILPCEQVDNSIPIVDIEIYKNVSILVYSTNRNHLLLDTINRYLDNVDIKYNLLDSTETLIIKDEYDLLIIDREDSFEYMELLQKYLDNNGKVLLVENKFNSKECHLEGNVKLVYSPMLPDKLFDTLYKLIASVEASDRDGESIDKNISLKEYKVLVVDDNMVSIKLMLEILKKYELQTVGCCSPKEALVLFENESFDIVFIDQNMPIMNGDEAIIKMREIEKSKSQRRVRIYALTGDVDVNIDKKMIDAGADSVFTKPLHIKEIYKAVLDALDKTEGL